MRDIFGFYQEKSHDERRMQLKKYLVNDVGEAAEFVVLSQKAKAIVVKHQNKTALRIFLAIIFGFFSVFSLLLLLFALPKIHNPTKINLIIFYSVMLIGLAFLTLTIFTIIDIKRIDKMFLKSSECAEGKKLLEELESRRKEFFGLPDTAITAEIICSVYSAKVLKRRKIIKNRTANIYIENDIIHFVGVDFNFAIPLNLLKKSEVIKQEVRFDSWNKKEAYKQFGVSMDSGFYAVCGYGTLVFEDEEGEFFIKIMNYDFDKVKQLIDL